MASSVSSRLSSVVTYLFVIGFGIGSWIAVNGLWAELPLLTQTSPDRSYLQSTLNVTLQLANIGPFAYLLLDLFIANVCNKKKKIINPHSFVSLSICLLVAVGVLSCVCLSVWYNATAFIAGREHSVALIVLGFLMGLVDCTSTVTFIPFMKGFSSSRFMTALFVGEGLSGVFPSLFALAQGIGVPVQAPGNASNASNSTGSATVATISPNFSPQVYFLLLAVLVVVCGFSFGMLQVLPWLTPGGEGSSPGNGGRPVGNSPAGEEDEKRERAMTDASEDKLDVEEDSPLMFGPGEEPLSAKCSSIFCFPSYRKTLPLLVMMGVLNFISNGAINAVSFFAFSCYGPLTYLVALNLGLLVNPLVVFVSLCLPLRSHLAAGALFAGSCLLGAVLVLWGFLGLTIHLPLLGSPGGSAIVILLNVAASAVISSTKVTIATKIQKDSREEGVSLGLPSNEECALKWCGVSIQIGSLAGAVLFYLIVVVGLHEWVDAFFPSCSAYPQW